MPVAHTCNPSYSGGRDQEDLSSKPAWANNPRDPILKKPITKKDCVMAQSVGPKFKPQYRKKKFKKKGCNEQTSAVLFLPKVQDSNLNTRKHQMNQT
jgi:hypothetical protein